MHSDSATLRINQARVDRATLERVEADHARVGRFLEEHPLARRVLRSHADKFLQASGIARQKEVAVPSVTTPVSHDFSVALQNHLSSELPETTIHLPQPKSDNVVPMMPKHPRELVGAGHNQRAAVN